MDIEHTKPTEELGAEHAPGGKRPLLKRLNWKIWAVACFLAIAFVTIGFMRGNATPTSAAGNLPTVAVVKVTRQDLSQEQTFDAEFRPYQEIDLHAKVAGFVKTINVDIGDRVAQGALLATLEIPELNEDLEKANAQELRDEKEIARAAAAYDDVHLAYTRLAAINQTHSNLVAQQEIDTARTRDDAAAAALATAKQQVAVSKAEVDKLNAMQDYCKITAPFAGVITKRYADEGTLVQGGVSPSGSAMPLVRLSQNDRLRLDFPVSVSYVARVKVGDPVEIRVRAMDRTIAGKICRIARKVDTDTRTMEAEVDVPNSDLSLTPGVYAEAAVTLDRREHVLTVPVEAVSNPASPTVFVLNPANELEERPVTLGLETPEKIEIVAGLKENDLVMIGSRALVKPGEKVETKISEMGNAQ